MKKLLPLIILAACGSKKPVVAPPPPPTPTPDAGPVAPPDAAPKEAQVFPTQTAQPQDLAFPEEAFRAKQPDPMPARPFHLPKIKPFKLDDGVTVYLVEQHTLPIVSMDLSIDGGTMTDPAGKEGLASVCMSMLSEATEKLSKSDYADALADIAAGVDGYANADTQGVALSSLTKHLDAAFPLYVDAILHPRFDPDDFDLMVKRRLESLRQAKGSATSIAGRITGPVMYGDAHPFGRIVTEQSLAALKLDDCKAYAKKWLAPKGARLFVVGDMTADQIKAMWKTGFAGWKGTVPKLAKPPAPKAMKGRVFFVDVPGAQQSAVTVLHMGPMRKAKDFFANAIMSSVLGGGFAGRINMNLREDKGYTYGAYGSFSYSQYYGVYAAGGSIVTPATYQSVVELHKELAALHDGTKPATDDELSREKTGAVLALPGRFATASDALQTFRGLVYYGLPLDYFATYAKNIQAVTAKQVAASAKAHLYPDDSIYIVVGDGSAAQIQRADGAKQDAPLTGADGKPETLLDSLKQLVAAGTLGKGDLVVLDADGKPKQ